VRAALSCRFYTVMEELYDRTNHSLVSAVLVRAIVVPQKLDIFIATNGCLQWNLFSVVSPVAIHVVIVHRWRYMTSLLLTSGKPGTFPTFSNFQDGFY
jgi:hypothetical protein